MVGRNEPCPCGSGKKYKKCCEGKAQVTVETVFHDEVEAILTNFYVNYPERKDFAAYHEVLNNWTPSLKDALQVELIEAVVIDEFFFHNRLDIWTNFLKRTARKTVRPATLNLLEKWAKPTLFLGKVVAVEEKYFVAKEALTGELVRIRREVNKPIPLDMGVFAFTLLDGTDEVQRLSVSSLIFFPTQYNNVFEKFTKDFQAQNELSAVEFGEKHHLDFWQAMVTAGYTGEEFTSFEKDVLNQVAQFLEEKGLTDDKLMVALEDYLVAQQPTARKPAAIAAGAVRFGQERQLFTGNTFTVKEIAESFDISASSLNKYYQELLAYYQV